MPIKITVADLKDTHWQVQARMRHFLADRTSPGHANQWEPIFVEQPDKTTITRRDGKVDEVHVYRPYHYSTLEAAIAALERYLEIESSLPNALARICTGDYRRFLDHCEVRIVQVGPACVTVSVVEDPPVSRHLRRDQYQGDKPDPTVVTSAFGHTFNPNSRGVCMVCGQSPFHPAHHY